MNNIWFFYECLQRSLGFGSLWLHAHDGTLYFHWHVDRTRYYVLAMKEHEVLRMAFPEVVARESAVELREKYRADGGNPS